MEIVLYIALEALLAGVISAYIMLRIKNKKAMNSIINLEIDKNILLDKLSEELNKSSLASMESNNDFVKFLSDSREAAFLYIEDVQGALNSFMLKMDKQIKYYHTFGQVIDSPHKTILDDISKIYDDLKKVMPE